MAKRIAAGIIERLSFAPEECFAASERGEYLLAKPAQTLPSGLDIVPRACALAGESVDESSCRTLTGARTFLFFQNQAIFNQKFTPAQNLTHGWHPVSEMQGLVDVAGKYPDCRFMP